MTDRSSQFAALLGLTTLALVALGCQPKNCPEPEPPTANVADPVAAETAPVEPETAEPAEKCEKPPEFVGAPAGTAPFNVTAGAVAAGDVRYFQFGDELFVAGGEGGSRAITLHAKDDCGLWLRVTAGPSYVFDSNPTLDRPTFRTVSAGESGAFEIEFEGAVVEVTEVSVGRFEVTLKTPIEEYEGE